MSDETVKIGFVGVGTMGQCAHLKNYAALDQCEVTAIAELRPRLAAEVARKYGVPRTYRDHTEMLADEDLDGIVASQPYQRHGQIVPELLGADIPIFTEKPLAGSVEVGKRIFDAEKYRGTTHMLGYHKRSDPATIRTKEEIGRLAESGELGELQYVRILMPAGDWVASGFNELISSDEELPDLEFDPPPPDMDEETRAAYNSFVNYYIHQVNLMRHLLGEPYEVTYAEPSGVLLAVESHSGVAGTIEMSPYRTTVDWQESALVAFAKGWLRLELPAPLACNRPGQLTIYRDPGGDAEPQRVEPRLPWTHAMRQQAVNFLKVCRGEAEPICDAEEALEDLRVAKDYVLMRRESQG